MCFVLTRFFVWFSTCWMSSVVLTGELFAILSSKSWKNRCYFGTTQTRNSLWKKSETEQIDYGCNYVMKTFFIPKHSRCLVLSDHVCYQESPFTDVFLRTSRMNSSLHQWCVWMDRRTSCSAARAQTSRCLLRRSALKRCCLRGNRETHTQSPKRKPPLSFTVTLNRHVSE